MYRGMDSSRSLQVLATKSGSRQFLDLCPLVEKHPAQYTAAATANKKRPGELVPLTGKLPPSPMVVGRVCMDSDCS